MRKGFGFMEVLIVLVVLSFILAIANGVVRSGKTTAEARKIFAKRAIGESWLEIAKRKCETDGEGSWSNSAKVLNLYPVEVRYSCTKTGDLYRADVMVCENGKCGVERSGYVFSK